MPDKKMVKSEASKLLLLLIITATAMKLVFYKQDIISTTRTALALFWMFMLPGYALTHYWKSRMDFGERIVIGTAAAAAFTAIASYYLGLTGLQVKYHGILLPTAMLAAAAAIAMKKRQPLS